MTMFKKFIAAVMVIIMVFTLSVTASAADTRDYSQYTSKYATANMTKSEIELYNRLDEIAYKYLTTDINAVYKSNGYYTDDILISDLGLTVNDAYNVAYWFRVNNPQYYFLSNIVSSRSVTHTQNGKVTSTDHYISLSVYDFAGSGSNRSQITKQYFEVIDELVYYATDDEKTNYQKEVTINRLLADNLTYQSDAPYNQSPVSAFLIRATVCAGYATAFSLLCNAVGIDCLTVTSDNHAWNVVKLDDGNWYITDPTWNDTGDVIDFVFNCGENTVKAIDNENYSNKDSHIYDTQSAKWKPATSTIDYVVTDYDLTGNNSDENHEQILAVADVNGDGHITAADATTILKMVVDIIPKEGLLGDVDGDKIISSKDATEILKYVVKLPSALDKL